MSGFALPAGATKEIRALLPAWLACTATVAAAGLLGWRQLIPIGLLTYGLGTIALGAQSIGHEYSHRTLGLFLSQPSTRRRLFFTKMSVLGAMLILLSAVGWATLYDPLFDRLRPQDLPLGAQPSTIALFVLLFALFVTPCLTMVCRNPLAAVVFTITIPGLLLVGGEMLGIARFGFNNGAQVDAFRLAFFWGGMYLVSGAAALATWFLFMRLEATEGRGTEFHLPRWQGATTEAAPSARPRNAVWLLVKKELRLQQMAFVIAGLFVLGWASLALVQRLVPEFAVGAWQVLVFLYCGLISVVVGSLASAEERQFGTLEWQVLLPMATSRQWAVKVITAMTLAVLLGAVMPLVITRLGPFGNELRLSGRMNVEIVLIAVAITSGSLYLSSLCSSGIRAVVLTLPVAAVLVVVVPWTDILISRALRPVPFASLVPALRPLRGTFAGSFEWIVFAVAAGGVGLLLRLALQNHRSSERSPRRIWPQAGKIAGYMVGGMTFIAVIEILVFAVMRVPRP